MSVVVNNEGSWDESWGRVISSPTCSGYPHIHSVDPRRGSWTQSGPQLMFELCLTAISLGENSPGILGTGHSLVHGST